MNKIVVGEHELPAAEISVGGSSVKIWPPMVARKLHEKLQIETK